MAKERLSKLQKWILEQSYKLNILHDGSVVGRESSGYYRRGENGTVGKELVYQYFECWIYENYYGFNSWYGDGFSQTPEYQKAHVTVCRSVRSMEEKGLIAIKNYLSYGMRNWQITSKGINALKELCESKP